MTLNRVILIAPLPPPYGGIATWTQLIVDNKNMIENDIILIDSRRNSKSRFFILFFISNLIRSLKIIWLTQKKVKKENANIIHINSTCSLFGLIRELIIANLLARKTKIIIHFRCNIPDQINRSLTKTILLKQLLIKTNLAITLNKESKGYIYGLIKLNSIILPNFIDTKKIKYQYEVKKQIKEIIFVGHVIKQKGIFELFEVAKRLPQYNFKIVGPIFIKKLPKLNNVTFLGGLDQSKVTMHLLKSDLFLLPTYSEGFSNAILEAMLIGLPIITTNVGANLEMLEQKGGEIVPKKDSIRLYQAITKLENHELRNKMSTWNINKVTSNYSLSKVLNDLSAIYSSIN